jgi:hypothetical protein
VPEVTYASYFLCLQWWDIGYFIFVLQDVGVIIRDENDIKNVFNYIRQYIWRRSIYSNRRESAVINIVNDSPSK